MPYSERILIVEDVGLIALDIKTMLFGVGFINIKVTYNGREAIKYSEEYKPDLILMDIMLGDGMNGIETAHTIQKDLQVPLIYITGSTDIETQNEALETSPVTIINKPVHLPELEYAVKTALGLNLNPGLTLQGI